MRRVPANTLTGNGESVLAEPRRLLRAHRLGEPGEEIVAADGDETVVARIDEIREVRLTHLDLAPAERERLCSGSQPCDTVFVHRLADVNVRDAPEDADHV